MNSNFRDRSDPLYEEAKRIVVESKKPSISHIQRMLRIGYNHAVRLLEAMEGDVVTVADQAGIRRLLPNSVDDSANHALSKNEIIDFPVPDELTRKYGVSSAQLRAATKPLFLLMHDHGIPDLSIKRDGAACVLTIGGKTV